MGATVLACSIDSQFSHKAWLETPREKGGIKGVEYGLLSDVGGKIAKSYDVLNEEDGIAYRGLFLIDRDSIIRHQSINDLPLGGQTRNPRNYVVAPGEPPYRKVTEEGNF